MLKGRNEGQNFNGDIDNAPCDAHARDNQVADNQDVVHRRPFQDNFASILDDLAPMIATPQIQTTQLELKSVMFNILNSIEQFSGSPREDAQEHIRTFLEVCECFKQPGVHEDVLRLKLFPYSLRDRAWTWLKGVAPGSIESWDDLCR
ncbi:hypothetical protein GQ457_13G016490 [Hibiscus cannabinus]